LAKDSYARPQKNTKAELYLMLAEAVRNTQQQSVNTQPEPVRDVQREPKRKTRPAPKRPAKNKSVRASASRKSRPKSKSHR
jgi:hypothetical protein